MRGCVTVSRPRDRLAGFYGRFGGAASVGGEGTANVHFILELAFFVPAHITAVAFMRLDQGAFAGLLFVFPAADFVFVALLFVLAGVPKYSNGNALTAVRGGPKWIANDPQVIHPASLDILLRHINERLVKRKFCVVFENDLQRVWPTRERERARRAAAIEAFARAHGFTATIHDPGIRVTFRRLPSVTA
jgi:hypothetical protein